MGKAQYTVKQFADAIPGSGGIISTIAKRVGCDWGTADKWCKDSPTLARLLQDERESILDLSESVLFKSIRDGDTSDAKWLLARRGKHRGYADKQDIEMTAKVDMRGEVKHELDSDTAQSVFDILARVGAFQPGTDAGEDDEVHPPSADS